MQGSIDTALSLVAAGNAFLRGEDVTGFWPDAQGFTYTKTCEFRAPPDDGGEDFPLVAEDPHAWFASLKPWCKGLRLHNSPSLIQPGQLAGITERESVAFVGGGPRWLVEAVGDGRCELWESFQSIGDQNDPQQKMWLTTWIRQGEDAPFDAAAIRLETAIAELSAVLPEIAAFARREQLDNFAELFETAMGLLDGQTEGNLAFSGDLMRYGHTDQRLAAIYAAVGHAWVFGGMGSWNDLGGVPDPYEELSERLFRALCDVVCGIATATYCG